ncbi:MAG: TlpA disulfide reductase family protein [Rhodospirillales bacterium]|nr:TlpA disulfide reductase family protein [Rhodospirillales bacterium]
MNVNKVMVVVVLGAAVLAALAMAVIESITGPRSTREALACMAGEGVLGNYQTTEPPGAAVEAVMTDAKGAERTLAEWRGSGLVLNFWATWCAPCVREMPALDRLGPMVAGEGIKVLALSEDRGKPSVVETFYKKHAIKNLPVLMDKRRKLLTGFAVQGLPTTVLLNTNGNEVGRVVGVAEWDSDDAAAFLRRCLTPPPPAPGS